MPAEFVDTNILVYAYDQTAGLKHQSARKLMERLWDSGEGILSTQVLQEFHVTVTSKIPKPIPARRVREIISDLGTWTVATLDVPEILNASELSERYRLNFLGCSDLGCRSKRRNRYLMVGRLQLWSRLRRGYRSKSFPPLIASSSSRRGVSRFRPRVGHAYEKLENTEREDARRQSPAR